MTLCDSNVWLALALSKHIHQVAARKWFDAVDEAGALIFCRATQQTLLRLLTNASVLAPYGNAALTNKEAWEVYEELVADDRVVLRLEEPVGLESRWRALSSSNKASPKLWMDAYLAAFAISAGCTLVSTDAGFKQFRELDLLLLR